VTPYELNKTKKYIYKKAKSSFSCFEEVDVLICRVTCYRASSDPVTHLGLERSAGVQTGVIMAKFTKTSSTIALCSLANLINAADRVIMPIAIIQMSAEFKWNLHEQGWILSAFAIGYLSSQVRTISCLVESLLCYMYAIRFRPLING